MRQGHGRTGKGRGGGERRRVEQWKIVERNRKEIQMREGVNGGDREEREDGGKEMSALGMRLRNDRREEMYVTVRRKREQKGISGRRDGGNE